MICSSCGAQNARVYRRMIDGRERELTLCPSCFEKLYPEKEPDLLSSFMGRTGGSGKVCPSCGTSFEEYRLTGLLGCAECYNAFREELLPAIRYVQGGRIRHKGKAPSGIAEEKYDAVRDLVREQESLRARLREAVRTGDRESEKSLRASLDAVNRKLYGGEDV